MIFKALAFIIVLVIMAITFAKAVTDRDPNRRAGAVVLGIFEIVPLIYIIQH
jgi:hypothetical protein